MKLAINYSRPSAALAAAGHIRVDYFKLPPWPEAIAEAQAFGPLQIHFEIVAGRGDLLQTDWGRVAAIREATGTPFVNLHVFPYASQFPGIPLDTTDEVHIRRVTDALLREVGALVERFGPEAVIAENVPYYGLKGDMLRPGVLPEVLREVCEKTGCGLLLDISHARIAAHHLGMDERDYISSLPVDRVRELHFTGLHTLDGELRDHLPILPTDWPVLDWALGCIHRGEWGLPWLLAFEYGGIGEWFAARSDPAVIAEQVPMLWERVKRP